jgi:hypothetical protein
MSLWNCPEHGLHGGDVLCPACSKNGNYVTVGPDSARVDEATLPQGMTSPTNPADEIERVARALHAAFTPYADYSYSWDDPLASKDMFRALAKAAIAALTNTTEGGGSDTRPVLRTEQVKP